MDITHIKEQGLDLPKIYAKLGIKKGDTVFIHSKLLAFGGVAGSKEELARFFLDPLLQLIGPSGTVVALSYTFSYTSHGTPYVHEKSPSEAGLLTEYIRTMKGTERSFHPFISVVAYGARAKQITKDVPRSAYAWGSPWQRMHELKAKCLYLGLTCGVSCTFLHYVEQQYGVPYCFDKAFFHPAYKKGKLQKGPFLGYFRKRASAGYSFAPFGKEMKKRKLVKEHLHSGVPIQVHSFDDAFTVCMDMLDTDPCVLIREPYYMAE